MGIISSAIQGGSGIIGSWITGRYNKKMTERTNEANKKLAEYSYDQQRQMIREQNEYNTPLSQMQRYQEAGLNPNLIYGNIDSGNQGQIAKYDAPTMQAPTTPPVDIAGAIRLALEAKQVEANIKNTEAQTQRYNEETRSIMMRNAWDSFLSGVPTDGWSFEGSRRLQQYDLGLRSQSLTNVLTEQKAEFQRLSNREKDFFLNNLLPLTLKLKEMEIEGVSYDNAMKAIDASLWHDKRVAEMSSSPFKIIGQVADGILNNGSESSEAFKDWLSHPFSKKYNPTYQMGKYVVDWFKSRRNRRK